jgi:hypothetical protein
MPTTKVGIATIDDRATSGRATSERGIGEGHVESLIGRRAEENRGTVPRGLIVDRRVDRIDIAKIDILGQTVSAARTGLGRSTARCRRSRSNFCRARLHSKTSLPKSNPAPSRIRFLRSRGCSSKKRRATMFN